MSSNLYNAVQVEQILAVSAASIKALLRDKLSHTQETMKVVIEGHEAKHPSTDGSFLEMVAEFGRKGAMSLKDIEMMPTISGIATNTNGGLDPVSVTLWENFLKSGEVVDLMNTFDAFECANAGKPFSQFIASDTSDDEYWRFETTLFGDDGAEVLSLSFKMLKAYEMKIGPVNFAKLRASAEGYFNFYGRMSDTYGKDDSIVSTQSRKASVEAPKAEALVEVQGTHSHLWGLF